MRSHFALVAAVGTAISMVGALPLPSAQELATELNGDATYYVRMASDPFRFVESPFGFGFRILTPLIVSLTGPPHWGFPLVNGLLTGIALPCAFLAFLRQFYAPATALWGTLLLLGSGVTRSLALSPYLVDALPHVLVVLALLALVRTNYAGCALALSLGVFAKESTLIVLPVVVVHALLEGHTRRFDFWVAVGVPVAGHLILRETSLVFGHIPHSYDHLSAGTVNWALARQERWGGVAKNLFSTVLYSFGPVWLTAALGWRFAARRVRVTALYSFLCLASLLVTADWGRVGTYGFPGIIGLSCALPLARGMRIVVLAATTLLAMGIYFLPGSTAKYLAAATAVSLPAVWGWAGARLGAPSRGR